MPEGPEGGEQPKETEPDYRYTLANERTFLAWMRTCLALLAAAVAVVQYAPGLGPKHFRDLCGVVFAVLAAGSAAGGLWRWWSTQRAMQHGDHLSRGALPAAIAVVLSLVAIGVIAVIVAELA